MTSGSSSRPAANAPDRSRTWSTSPRDPASLRARAPRLAAASMAAPRVTGRRRPRAARRAQDVRIDAAPDREFRGRARLGLRTKVLVKRLKPGDIAVIHHEDLDRVAADDLVAAGIRCVVNVCQSSSGRYPNAGPMIL